MLRGTLRSGTLEKIVTFSEHELEQFKELSSAKKAAMEKKLEEHVTDYTKSRPLGT